jgi:sarcosine oxidase subunit beta
MKTEVAIIGGGIIGRAAAYYLARKGFRVTILEKDPGVGQQASGRNGGGVRQHGRKAALPLAMASVRLWATLAQELGSDLEYVRTGNLNIALDEASVAAFEREIAWEHTHGLKEVRLLTADECLAFVPSLTVRPLGGKYCPTDGVANPMLVTPAFARAGKQLGVKFKLGATVMGLLQQRSRVCGLRTENEEIEAQTVINAAGPWASHFGAQAGCPMPIGPGRSQLMITERLPKQLIPMWVTVRGQGYIRPTVSGNLVMGTGGARNDEYSRHVDFGTAALHAERWCRFFDWLGNVSIIRTFSGITEYTPDGEPYIGAGPGIRGYYVAAGFHGEGFCLGPLVGKILAELVVGGEACVPLEPFRPDRFAKDIKAGKSIPAIVYPLDKMFSGKLRLANDRTVNI